MQEYNTANQDIISLLGHSFRVLQESRIPSPSLSNGAFKLMPSSSEKKKLPDSVYFLINKQINR